MKKILFSLILFTFISMTIEANSNHRHFAYYPVSVQLFYDELNPYGDWIYTPEYGYVWRPYFDYPDAFRPYSSNGRWIYTDYGWTWVSDYSWGWATFHYGRWYLDDYLGWMWIPGYEWAPAWVAWGSYEGYWGWAPLGPGFHISVGYDRYIPSGWWTFVPQRHFCSHHWNHYIYDRPVNVTYITNITNIYNSQESTGTSWYYGPRRSDVEHYAKTRVPRHDIVNSDNPENRVVSQNQVKMYRPVIEREARDARPVSYKPVENERRSERFQPRPAAQNDPGKNTVRDKRDASSTGSPRVASNPRTEQRETRVEPRSGQNQPGRTEPAGNVRTTEKRESSKEIYTPEKEVRTPEKREPAKEVREDRQRVNSREYESRPGTPNDNINNRENNRGTGEKPGQVSERNPGKGQFEKAERKEVKPGTVPEARKVSGREKTKTTVKNRSEEKTRQNSPSVTRKNSENKVPEKKSNPQQRSR